MEGMHDGTIVRGGYVSMREDVPAGSSVLDAARLILQNAGAGLEEREEAHSADGVG